MRQYRFNNREIIANLNRILGIDLRVYKEKEVEKYEPGYFQCVTYADGTVQLRGPLSGYSITVNIDIETSQGVAMGYNLSMVFDYIDDTYENRLLIDDYFSTLMGVENGDWKAVIEPYPSGKRFRVSFDGGIGIIMDHSEYGIARNMANVIEGQWSYQYACEALLAILKKTHR